MSHPFPSPNHQRRVKRVALRLVELLEALDLPRAERRTPLPAKVAGDARRTLGDAEALLHGNLLPPDGTCSPGELFASALLNLKLVSHYKDLAQKANFR